MFFRVFRVGSFWEATIRACCSTCVLFPNSKKLCPARLRGGSEVGFRGGYEAAPTFWERRGEGLKQGAGAVLSRCCGGVVLFGRSSGEFQKYTVRFRAGLGGCARVALRRVLGMCGGVLGRLREQSEELGWQMHGVALPVTGPGCQRTVLLRIPL